MDPLLSTLLLTVLALLGARVSFSTGQVPAGPRLLIRTGVHFLALGFLLGPSALGLVSASAVDQLSPLLGLSLGWVGLLFGMQLDRGSLRQFPLAFQVMAFGQAALTFLAVLGGGSLLLEATGLVEPAHRLLLFAVAAIASISTPAGIAIVSSNFLARGRLLELLFFVASVDGLIGILALQMGYAFFPARSLTAGLEWFAPPVTVILATCLGILCGVVFLWLQQLRPNREELVLYLLGISALSSGAALQLQMAPLFVSAVMGIVVANLVPDRPRVFRTLERWEKPIYVVLLLLAGASLEFSTWWLVPLALLYTAGRAVAKGVAGAVLARALRGPTQAPLSFGLGLIPQGGIALALAVSMLLTYRGLTLSDGTDAVGIFFAVIVLGVIASEVIGLSLMVRVLRRVGAIHPKVEAALEEGQELAEGVDSVL